MPEEPRYGRGKFQAHPRYIAYMEMVVSHPTFADMPNAVSNGRINWQVSSGRTTSYYEFYPDRFDWWVRKADELGLPGQGNSNDRFTVAARLINPTGKRPCRLCGEERDVGYFYLNDRLAKRLNKTLRTDEFKKWQPASSVLEVVGPGRQAMSILLDVFPERANELKQFGAVTEVFEKTRHRRTTWLSPGFMGNPPDRLDGFHDYCLFCRAKSDPGRSDENMRSYANDRRAFEWWSEGDWKLADALFNSAGPGACSLCNVKVSKVSPDHVGPLACGFKQMPLFVPMCGPCNSAKNRRLSKQDVARLLKYEEDSGESAAGWHIRGCWDARKRRITSDSLAAALSTDLRTIQDVYLRVLERLLREGNARFLVTLLNPDCAFYDHTFLDLDPTNLTYSGVITTRVESLGRTSLARRSVRIAFDELRTYVEKPVERRRLRGELVALLESLSNKVSNLASVTPKDELDQAWNAAVAPEISVEDREKQIGSLLLRGDVRNPSLAQLRISVEESFIRFASRV